MHDKQYFFFLRVKYTHQFQHLSTLAGRAVEVAGNKGVTSDHCHYLKSPLPTRKLRLTWMIWKLDRWSTVTGTDCATTCRNQPVPHSTERNPSC